ncbi:hypothetical protein A2765_01370 [Candidatus Kaiserbacteria bacterium RIFCSPHIGHO2_01_FULL_56_24]|uniref:Uncharacterized protein n=1 Tax=Candidatus Kaiserbacteria bacterium RIFCSPHIGHO2_01_FULL_56_24 TaxID=1798487 RepID=A0A1F6DH89_9BACT|nr:MAG: hypothetical protein A2765_01370 [Candidatus Kaiserbacteria bacterium RIFCSPHIGHO2_01_FULL_56_24]
MTRKPLEGPQAGDEVEIYQPANVPLEDVRKMIKKLTGFDVHIRARFGPTSLTIEKGDTKVNCPVTAIDDKHLEGTFASTIPSVGECLYIGYLKKPE